MPEFSQDYALVIGLNDYPTYYDGRSLEGAIRDAENVAVWLRDKAVGGGLPHDHVKLILSEANPLRPDQDDIDDALKEIADLAKKTGARRLYFYFSGHGHVTGKFHDDVVLCLPKWSPEDRNAALSSDLYFNYILKCSPFTEVVMLLDCCRNWVVDSAGRNTRRECTVPADIERKTFVAYACAFKQSAFEANTADEVRGHFTQALLAGLCAGAARTQGGVTARALQRYLEANVDQIAQAAGHSQRPEIRLSMREQDFDTMIFGSAPPEFKVEITFGADRNGSIELEGPTTDILKEGDASTGPWRLRLETGLYLLRECATSNEQVFRFVPTAEVSNVTF